MRVRLFRINDVGDWVTPQRLPDDYSVLSVFVLSGERRAGTFDAVRSKSFDSIELGDKIPYDEDFDDAAS